MKIFYFTTTGNSLDIAKRLGGELYSIPQVLKEEELKFEDKQAIGIIFPTYGFSVPSIVVEFLKKVKLKSRYIFAVATYGNKDLGVINHFMHIAREKDINVNYARSILMVDNAVTYFDIEKQIELLPKKKTKENIQQIIADIKDRKNNIKTSNVVSAGVSCAMYRFQDIVKSRNYKQFRVENHCIGCRTCVNVCPVHNIHMEGNRPVYQKDCMGCLACTHNCPVNAIRVKFEKSKARFRNEEVSLKEIIDSNQQKRNF